MNNKGACTKMATTSTPLALYFLLPVMTGAPEIEPNGIVASGRPPGGFSAAFDFPGLLRRQFRFDLPLIADYGAPLGLGFCRFLSHDFQLLRCDASTRCRNQHFKVAQSTRRPAPWGSVQDLARYFFTF